MIGMRAIGTITLTAALAIGACTTYSSKALADLSNASCPIQAFRDMVMEWMSPDWGNKVVQSWNTTYTAPSAGYVYISGSSNNWSVVQIQINNGLPSQIALAAGSDGGACYQGFLCPIGAGDTYLGTGGSSSQSIMFIPCKGAAAPEES